MVLYGGNGKKKNRSLYYYLINCTTRNIKVIEWQVSHPLPRVTCSLWFKSPRCKP